MNLQEKLISVLYKTSSANYASELLVKIADEFAIGFSEWMVSGVEFLDDTEQGRIYLYKHNRYFTKELLEIYKKKKDYEKES